MERIKPKRDKAKNPKPSDFTGKYAPKTKVNKDTVEEGSYYRVWSTVERHIIILNHCKVLKKYSRTAYVEDYTQGQPRRLVMSFCNVSFERMPAQLPTIPAHLR